MSIKPILFSTPMVQAILAGRKTMTRRVIKPQTYGTDPIYNPSAFEPDRGWYFRGGDHITSRYHVLDILWVRETWSDKPGFTKNHTPCFYRADQPDLDIGRASICGKWRPSIFMPREAARIWLQVTGVRCERVQNITPYGAWLDGCRIGNAYPWEQHIPELQQMCRDMLFRSLWDDLNAKRGYGWDTNPWVWVYTFERCEKP